MSHFTEENMDTDIKLSLHATGYDPVRGKHNVSSIVMHVPSSLAAKMLLTLKCQWERKALDRKFWVYVQCFNQKGNQTELLLRSTDTLKPPCLSAAPILGLLSASQAPPTAILYPLMRSLVPRDSLGYLAKSQNPFLCCDTFLSHPSCQVPDLSALGSQDFQSMETEIGLSYSPQSTLLLLEA